MKRYWLASTCFVGLSVLTGAAVATVCGVPCPWYQRVPPAPATPSTPADPPGTRSSFPTPDPSSAVIGSVPHTIGASPLRDITHAIPARVTIRPAGPARDAFARVLVGKAPGARVHLDIRGIRPLAATGCTLRVFVGQLDATADTRAERPAWCGTVGVVGARVATVTLDVTEGVRALAREKRVSAEEVRVCLVLVEDGDGRQSVWVERVALRVEE